MREVTVSEFSLRALIREVLSEDTSEDLAAILKEIIRRIPPEHVQAALEQAIYSALHAEVTRPRPGPVPSGGKGSAKVRRIREHWRKVLESRYTVENGKLRRIGDMDSDDVLFVAGHLEEIARQNVSQAERMRGVAGKMAELGVARVRDLPEDYLASAFSRDM